MPEQAFKTVSLLAGVCLVAAAGLTLSGCGQPAPAQPSPNSSEVSSSQKELPTAKPVETVSVTRETWQRVSDSPTAEVIPYETTDLYANISGFLNEVRVDLGAVVHGPRHDEQGRQVCEGQL